MIRERTSRSTIDKTFQKDVEQVGQLLKHLASQMNAGTRIQALADRKIAMSEKEIVHAEVVFLTEKQDDNVAIQRVKNWVGIKKPLEEGELFGGKISGNVPIDASTILKIQLYHFDHYPIRRLSEEKKTVKIIVYNPLYEEQYKNWHLAREMLTKDPAVCLLLNILPVAEITEEQQLEINGLYVQHLHLGDLGTSIKELFDDEDFQSKIRNAKLKNHVYYLDKVYQLILQNIKSKTCQLQGKSIISHKKQLQHQKKDTGLSSRDITHLKTAINDNLKQLSKSIDYAIDNFEKEDKHYTKLEKEIQSFFGFVEQKSGKYLTFRMAEGAVQDKVNKANKALGSFFDTTVHTVNDRFHKVTAETKDWFAKWKLQSAGRIAPPGKIDPLCEEFLLDDSITSSKSYDKQVPAKGIGSLLMELRTPLFMLMPIMMIFMLFNNLAGKSDEGEVGSEQFYNNRPCVAITRLPDSKEDQYIDFIGQVDKQRGKGVFDKEFNDDLTIEPQLAVKEKEVEGIGNKVKTVETLDYDYDEKTRILYLYLNENADREFVIEKLFDRSAKLLASSASGGGGGMGMGKIIKVMSHPNIKPYRYPVLVGLVALIFWYITTRKRSMDKELRDAKEREQKKLNEDLKQHLSKNVKQQLQRWKVKLLDQLGNQYTAFQQNVESLANAAIESGKQRKAQEYKVIQKRLTAIKSEKTLLSSLKNEQRKLESKLGDLKSKIDRLK